MFPSHQAARRAGVAALLWLLAPIGSAAPPRGVDPGADVTDVLVLSQNWTDDQAKRFYDLPQGSKLLPFDWFLHLEQPAADRPFRDADHIRALGYIARTPDPAGNPSGLPVGFTRDGKHLGLTCAACHTGQVQVGDKVWVIDGAPTQGDFEEFLRRLVRALRATAEDPAKFGRFADRVLGGGAAAAARDQLRADLTAAVVAREGYNRRNLPADGATPFGPGRVDAFGAIMNEVAETVAGVPGNSAPADAPVSYPFLWDTPQHDRVQWNGVAENRKTTNPLLRRLVGTEHIGALGRNAGEVLGVFGTMDAGQPGPLAQLGGYPSSINRANLIEAEESLAKLWSPLWPAELPPIDPTLRAKGAVLYQANCAACHELIKPARDDPDRAVKAELAVVGTDPRMATNFVTRKAKTGRFGGRLIELLAFPPKRFGDDALVGQMLRHAVQRGILKPDADLLALVKAEKSKLVQLLGELDDHLDFKIVGELAADGADALPRLGQFSFRQAGPNSPVAAGQAFKPAYKARPLNGVWATAPYLHNGSVPNLDELLKPAADRSQAAFRVGSRRFDPVKVGFVTDQGSEFDPTRTGNRNSGHDYGRHKVGDAHTGPVFTDDERRQLIEYLKSL